MNETESKTKQHEAVNSLLRKLRPQTEDGDFVCLMCGGIADPQDGRESIGHETWCEYAQAYRLLRAAPELLTALEAAKQTIRTWHGMRLDAAEEPEVWELYQPSPEMQQINAAIARAKGEAS